MEPRKYSLKAIKDIGNASPDGVIIYDTAVDRVVYANKAASKLIGADKNVLVDQPIAMMQKYFSHDQTAMHAAAMELKSNRRPNNFEFKLHSNEGESTFISCDAYFLANTTIIAAFVKNVTGAKQHSDYVTDYGARKDTILDKVAHNLSGPLNLTNNLLDLIDRQNVVKHNKQFDTAIHLVRENTQQCIEIINSFIKDEHLTSEHIFVERNYFDVLRKIKLVMQNLNEFDKSKEIKLEAESDELYIHSDDVKFFQIIQNLLSNAVKFTSDNGKVMVRVKEQSERLIFEIIDDGIGIPEPFQPYVFQKNTPAARTGLKGEKSVGMGLYIVKKLVHLLKGEISFSSEENEGSIFTFWIPKK